jgi:hypothetical protein
LYPPTGRLFSIKPLSLSRGSTLTPKKHRRSSSNLCRFAATAWSAAAPPGVPPDTKKQSTT